MAVDFNSAIPKFGLYGEATQRPEPEFVHLEKISERSRQNDWTIKPHRHGKLYQLLVLTNAEAEVQLDDSTHKLSGNWVICIPPGTVHGFRFPVNTQGEVLTVVDTITWSDAPHLQPYLEQLLEQAQLIEFKAEGVLFEQIMRYLGSIREELAATESAHTVMLSWLVKMVLVSIKRQLDHSPVIDQEKQNYKKQLTNDFRQSLELHYREHWSVQQYAKALHTSPSTLNRVCLEYLGMTAKTVSQDRLLMECKRRLIYTRETIDSIAYTLGFKDPSYFSRFFKKQEGLSPSDYRQEKYRETETSAL